MHARGHCDVIKGPHALLQAALYKFSLPVAACAMERHLAEANVGRLH